MSTLTFDQHAPISRTQRKRSVARPGIAPVAPGAVIAASHTFGQATSRWRLLPVVAAIAALHIAAVGAFSHSNASRSVPPQAKPVVIDIVPIRKEPLPPPPKPLTPVPRVRAVTPLKPAAAPTAAAPSHNLPVVSEPSTPSASADTVQLASAPSTPAPPAPAPAVEKVTEPRGYAGYLKNPAPDYPLAAQVCERCAGRPSWPSTSMCGA